MNPVRMNSVLGAVLADALALFRGDRSLLLRLGGAGLLWPAFALALLTAPPPRFPEAADAAATAAWQALLAAWLRSDGLWYLLVQAAALFTAAAVYALFLDRDRPAMGQALRRGAAAVPRLILAALLTAPAVALGLYLWVLPGLWVLGRLILLGPMLVAERPLGVLTAIGRSVRVTAGQGLAMSAAVAVPLLGGWLAGQPLVALDGWLRGAERLNPVALMIVDAGSAAVTMLAALAQALLAVAAYRRLARGR